MKSQFQAIGIVLSLSWAFSMCYTAIDDWTTNPVSTGIDNTAAPAKELPFPSVTTCRARPHHYSSWEVPKMIYNSLKLTDPDSPHAAEARQSFSQFVTNLIELALASTMKAQVSNLYINGTLIPGTFFLPSGHGGMAEGLLNVPFDVFYCDLALKIEEEIAKNPDYMKVLIELWKNATISMKEFNMDSLLDHFGVEIAAGDFGFFSMFNAGNCEVDYNVVMDFLAKFYTLDLNNAVFGKFGTTTELLVDEGKLWIMSKAAAPQWALDEDGDEYLVSVQYFVVMSQTSYP